MKPKCPHCGTVHNVMVNVVQDHIKCHACTKEFSINDELKKESDLQNGFDKADRDKAARELAEKQGAHKPKKEEPKKEESKEEQPAREEPKRESKKESKKSKRRKKKAE